MAYATQQNCIDRYGQNAVIVATDRDLDGAIDTAVLTNALADADSTINGYVGGLPGFPFAPVPDIFETLAVDIALYKAAAPAGVATEEQRKRYDDALKFLSLVGQGKVRLATDDGQDIVSHHATAEISSDTRRFSRETMDRLL